MDRHNTKDKGRLAMNKVTTFTIPFNLEEIKENINITTKTRSKLAKEHIMKQAIQFHSKGDIQKAVTYYQHFINEGFKDHIVFSNYGSILKSLGKLQEAKSYQLKAIEINPDFAQGYYNLGNVLRDLGKLQEAEVSIQKAIEINPDFAQAYLNLGNIFSDLGKLEEAEASLNKAIHLKPDLEQAYSNLGVILSDLGKLEEAEASLNKAIHLKPDFTDAHFNLFRHYEQINNLDKLKECLKEFSNIAIIKNELFLFRARLNFRNKEYKNAKKLIDNISPEWIEKSINRKQIIFWSYKAFIEEKIGNYDIAYSCFKKSQEDSSYTRISKLSFLKFISSYKKSVMNKKPIIKKFNDNFEDSNLGFLIGFPRSGTTLLDSILRSHPHIEVIEEKPLIKSIEKSIKEKFNANPENLFNISPDEIHFLRQKYVKSLNKYKSKDVNLIIDKLPLNTVSLPLINLLFPNSKIIFTHRHPYDTVLSCFQQTFEPNEAMANLVSLKLSSIMYDQVMDAWNIFQKNLKFNFITSKYENLIEDFDNHTLKILDFLGLGWDDNVKNYRKTALARGTINTPSFSQVVQPLYKTSIRKWKNYEKYFEDCHKYLDKWVVYFDY